MGKSVIYDKVFYFGKMEKKNIQKNNSRPLARIRKLLYTTRDASVAQWIEQWPPEPRA